MQLGLRRAIKAAAATHPTYPPFQRAPRLPPGRRAAAGRPGTGAQSPGPCQRGALSVAQPAREGSSRRPAAPRRLDGNGGQEWRWMADAERVQLGVQPVHAGNRVTLQTAHAWPAQKSSRSLVQLPHQSTAQSPPAGREQRGGGHAGEALVQSLGKPCHPAAQRGSSAGTGTPWQQQHANNLFGSQEKPHQVVRRGPVLVPDLHP